jgi:phenylalanine-4-hydroxylase
MPPWDGLRIRDVGDVGTAQIDLASDHPGFADPVYRSRRAQIAAVAERYVPGDAIPDVDYSDTERELWRVIADNLSVLHERFACAEVVRAGHELCLPHDRVPQLREVTDRLQQLTGFRMEPVPGLVPTRTFYAALANRRFLSTQYLRHASVPLYTPEPDLAHEVIGHGTTLASPALAQLYELAGHASLRAESEAALEFFSRVFWYTVEFGVVHERGALRAWGAGLLSSFGEIRAFREADVRPIDIWAMGTAAYDITHYQPVLFAGASFDHAVEETAAFFTSYDDEAYERLVHDHEGAGR